MPPPGLWSPKPELLATLAVVLLFPLLRHSSVSASQQEPLPLLSFSGEVDTGLHRLVDSRMMGTDKELKDLRENIQPPERSQQKQGNHQIHLEKCIQPVFPLPALESGVHVP